MAKFLGIRPQKMAGVMVESVKQYGVQIVWEDPVSAGAITLAQHKDPDFVYEPRWSVLDTLEQADAFAESYVSTLGRKMESASRQPYDGPDKDEPWMAHGVKEVNRAERWAVEVYGEWES